MLKQAGYNVRWVEFCDCKFPVPYPLDFVNLGNGRIGIIISPFSYGESFPKGRGEVWYLSRKGEDSYIVDGDRANSMELFDWSKI